MARLLADEDFPLEAVEAMRQLGDDVMTVQEAGFGGGGVRDEVILSIAIQHDRAVVTHNRWDFIPLHKRRPDHRGIVVCSRDEDPVALARRIHDAIVQHPSLHGLLIRVNLPPTPPSPRRRGRKRP